MFKKDLSVEDLFSGIDTGVEEKSVLYLENDEGIANNRFDLLYGEVLVTERKFNQAFAAGDIETAGELTAHIMLLENALDEEEDRMASMEADSLGNRGAMILDYASNLATEFLEAVISGEVAEKHPKLKSAFNRIAQMGALNAKNDAAITRIVINGDLPYITAAEVFAKAADSLGVLHEFKPYISQEFREKDVASMLDDMRASSLAKLCRPNLKMVK